MPEFSLNDSLDRIHAAGPSNPDFETTLKRNANTFYCRSQIYELIRYVSRRQFDVLAQFFETMMTEADGFADLEKCMPREKVETVSNEFNARPLAEMKPDCAAALARLPKVLRDIADYASNH